MSNVSIRHIARCLEALRKNAIRQFVTLEGTYAVD